MQLHPLTTHEIGSLAKPTWRVKAFSGVPLDTVDLKVAQDWGDRLNIEGRDQLFKILAKKKDFSKEDKATILHFSSLYATRLLEQAGLDLLWDGEQHRIEMYEHVIQHITGFVCRGHVRSFDNKYYAKASCVKPPSCPKPLHIEEYERIKHFTKKPIKVPISGAYTLVDWSFDECYSAEMVPGMAGIRDLSQAGRNQFLMDMAEGVIYPTLKGLLNKGALFLQIDEAAATTKRSEIPEFIETTKRSIGDLAGKAFFSMHLCFSEYARLFPAIKELEGIVSAIHLECANRDSLQLGVNATERTGYEILKLFKDTQFKIGIGVLDVHTDYIESPELIRDRILYACDVLEDPERIMVAPDCGLRTRTWEVAYTKLQNMVKGRNLAAIQLGLPL